MTQLAGQPKIVDPKHAGSRITVLMQPDGQLLSIPRPKTARQLLNALELMEETALVARGEDLLTPDRRIWPNDVIMVRVTSSRG